MDNLGNNALCQLPHRLWPVYVEVLEFVEQSQTARIRLNRDCMDRLNTWASTNSNIEVDWSQRDILVPGAWLVPNADIIRRRVGERVVPPSKILDTFVFENLNYKTEIIGDVQCGDFVWVISEGRVIHNAKVIFTGSRVTGYDPKLYVFVATGKVNRAGNEERHRIHPEHVYRLEDVIKMQNATKDMQVKAEHRGGILFLSANERTATSGDCVMASVEQEQSYTNDEADYSDKIGTCESKKEVEAFGFCFVRTYGFQNASVEGVNKDEVNISAKLPGEDVLGSIGSACFPLGAVSEAEAGVYVGIRFEASVTGPGSPIRIKHVQTNCKEGEDCDKGMHALIPLRLIPDRGDDPSSSVVSAFQLKEETVNSLLALKSNGIPLELPDPLQLDTFRNRIWLMGMEWKNNSCYLDSILFGMFAFTNSFDYVMEEFEKHQQEHDLTGDRLAANRRISFLLRCHIVAPLRRGFCVSSDALTEMREILSKHYNPLFKDRYMDAEEFALTLFGSVLNAPPFLHYDSGADDHVYQIFAHPSSSPEGDDSRIPTVQALLERSFIDSSVKLAKLPEPAFIVKLPVSNGKPVFPRIAITPRIFLGGLVHLEGARVDHHHGGQGQPNFHFHLRAVICLEQSHFTCFSRVGNGATEESEWVYHNSVASPRSVHVEGFGKGLECLMGGSKGEPPHEDAWKWVVKVMSTAYLCIYEKARQEDTLVSTFV